MDLQFLIHAVIAQIFSPTAKLAIPTGIPANEANTEIETQPLMAEIKTRKCLKSFKLLHSLLCFPQGHACSITKKCKNVQYKGTIMIFLPLLRHLECCTPSLHEWHAVLKLLSENKVFCFSKRALHVDTTHNKWLK